MELAEMKVVILSRGRSEDIMSHKIFPYADLIVPESEKQLYESKNLGLNIVTTPDDVRGLGRLRNWVLNHYQERCVVMVDDDIECLVNICNISPIRTYDPETIRLNLFNLAVMADDIGLGCFGYNQTCDVRKYEPSAPFKLNSWIGCVVGVIGRDIWFCDNMFKVDVDFCLQQLLKKRILLMDNRYSFSQVRDTNKGGNSLFRTKEKVDAEMAYLKDKWKGHINFSVKPTTIGVSLNVPRKR